MPFKKGQSGNPGGRSKELPFKTALNMQLKAVGDDDQRGLRKIAQNLIDQAETGEPWAIKEIADRLDGKPAQAHEVGGPDGEPLQVIISSDDDRL